MIVSRILSFVKFRVSAAATLSALSALAASSGGFNVAAPLALGVFLLACGACGLNEWQERGTDLLMLRTRGRPIPSGAMAPSSAVLLAVGLLAAGGLALFAAAGGRALLLGLAAAAWYNGVYTPLKRVTAFAVVPGALVGAVPPALGWLAGGGTLSDPRILSICLFFYLWQVPHFWLLAPEHEADLRLAGRPAAAAALGHARVGRLASVWMAAAAASTVLFPLFGTIRSTAVFVPLAAAACLLTWRAGRLLSTGPEPALLRRAFLEVNAYALLVMGLVSADQFLI
ncbi:MAG: UbiA family prenyltransferase [Elusimicrobia bacterium]|nr:UbiA family prenyltransferase [Elusimicrobiota bacterium]